MSSCVEMASGWYKSQEHLSPIDLHVFQAVGNSFQHLDLGVTAFSDAISDMDYQSGSGSAPASDLMCCPT